MPISGRGTSKNPSLLTFNGLPGAGTEVTAQQVEDQIDQLNQLSQQLRALPQNTAIEQATTGQQVPLTSRYVQQTSRVAPETGFGRPLGVDAGYLRNIAGNPLTGANGLTKDVLSDLMFGDLKSLAYSGGITNYNNPVEESSLSPQTLGNSALTGLLGKPGLGLPLPPNEKMVFNDLPTNDLNNLKDLSNLRSRHHTKTRRKKKGSKSDAVTKLLLSLLVDKLKDIYEMDKVHSNQIKPVKMDSLTIGKIENTLRERSQPKTNKIHSEKDGEKGTRLMENFETNLSFPLTISDKKGPQVSLVDFPKNSDNLAIDVDTKNIENIINGIENGNTIRKENSSSQIKGSNFYPGNNPQETSQKITKTINNDNINLLGKESGSEFHRVKLDPDVGETGKSGTIPSISDYHPTIDAAGTKDTPLRMFDVHTDKATVSALPTFSISSILNQEIPGNVKGSDRILNEEALGDVNPGSNSPTIKVPATASAINENKAASRYTGETETTNYLEASRVLGAVFNKVKDPLARKSVEVAIKAMLKLMKSDSTYSKKQTVPSMNKLWILQEKVRSLMKTIHQLSNAVVDQENKEISRKKKRLLRTKHRFFRKRIPRRHSSYYHKPHHAH